MKQKKLNKGLTLKKVTIVDLENQELNRAKGGYSQAPTCAIITCEFTFCNGCTMPMPCFHP